MVGNRTSRDSTDAVRRVHEYHVSATHVGSSPGEQRLSNIRECLKRMAHRRDSFGLDAYCFTQPPGDKATISVAGREAKYVIFSHSSRNVDLRLVLENANRIPFGMIASIFFTSHI